MLINGMQIVKATEAILFKEGIGLDELLDDIFKRYSSACKNRRPEEILLD